MTGPEISVVLTDCALAGRAQSAKLAQAMMEMACRLVVVLPSFHGTSLRLGLGYGNGRDSDNGVLLIIQEVVSLELLRS